MRNNPGGTIDSVVDMLDTLLPEGDLVSATYHDGHSEVLGTSDADEVNLPMVVITNENTASAAELFAQAIKDYNKGRTVGTQTYGKGVMQTIYPLSDGGALSITVAKYNPPKSENFDGVGVKPDYAVQLTAEQQRNFYELDEEIAQGTVRRVRQVQVDTPRFLLGERPLSAAQRGTAMHLLMQYLDLNGPDPEEQAASLTARHLLTPEQAASLDLEQVRRFLASPLAQRIRRAEQVYREYRFSLLLPAALYDPAAEPEDELMLQGVVDCAFRTEQGLVIVDFKTDRIRPEEAPARAELYRPQLTAYSQALSRVLETPVAEMVLYFFAPGCQVTL